MPNINTLINDIYCYISGQGKYPMPTEEDFKELSDIIAKMCTDRFKERMKQATEEPKFTLRMSNYGLPLRKLWYENKYPTANKYKPEDLLKFLIGDMCEAVILFIAKKTGHEVTHLQETVNIDGVEGHLDAVIDGVVMDVKSASAWAWKQKFQEAGLLHGKDDFAYIPQISGYKEALEERGDKVSGRVFIAQNKETGELAQLSIPDFIQYPVRRKIAETREALEKPTPPPEKCYPTEPEEDNGNQQLPRGCGYCRFKKECWKDSNFGYGIRAFKYSNGIKYFSKIVKHPKVPEVPLDERD